MCDNFRPCNLLYHANRNITLRSSVQPEYFSDNNLTILSSWKINTLFVKHYVKTNCAVLMKKKTLFMRTLRLRIKKGILGRLRVEAEY